MGICDDRVVIVTGAGGGLGRAHALAFAAEGARVVVNDIGTSREGEGSSDVPAQRVVDEILAAGGDAVVSIDDVTDWSGAGSLVHTAIDAFGRLDVLVNNAGFLRDRMLVSMSVEGWDAVIRNNLNGTFYVTREVAVASMIPQRRGRIVNIIANVARGFPGMVHTGAARAGVENMTKTLAVEWAQHGIGVNSIAPGVIRSSGTERYPEALVEMSRQRTPMKRLGTPGEVAELCAYLASEAASFVTGETWYIDGGAHLWGDTWILPDREPAPLPDVVAKLSAEP